MPYRLAKPLVLAEPSTDLHVGLDPEGRRFPPEARESLSSSQTALEAVPRVGSVDTAVKGLWNSVPATVGPAGPVSDC